MIKIKLNILIFFLLAGLTGCFMRSGARGIYHTIHSGETLASIARTYHTNYQELAELNNIQDSATIHPGQKIFIPDARRRRDARLADGSSREEKLQFVRNRFSWPLAGSITSPFGIRDGRKHDGLDIAAPIGTDIQASDNGTVVYAKKLRGYGNLILIKHSGDFFTAYAHNQINLVHEGGKTKKGEVIARVGASGRASGPHLHFEIRQGKKARNPLFLLPEAPPVAEVAAAKLRHRHGFIKTAEAKTEKPMAATKKSAMQRKKRKNHRRHR